MFSVLYIVHHDFASTNPHPNARRLFKAAASDKWKWWKSALLWQAWSEAKSWRRSSIDFSPSIFCQERRFWWWREKVIFAESFVKPSVPFRCPKSRRRPQLNREFVSTFRPTFNSFILFYWISHPRIHAWFKSINFNLQPSEKTACKICNGKKRWQKKKFHVKWASFILCHHRRLSSNLCFKTINKIFSHGSPLSMSGDWKRSDDLEAVKVFNDRSSPSTLSCLTSQEAWLNFAAEQFSQRLETFFSPSLFLRFVIKFSPSKHKQTI